MSDQAPVDVPSAVTESAGREPSRRVRASVLTVFGLTAAVWAAVVVGGYQALRGSGGAGAVRVADRTGSSAAPADVTLKDIRAITTLAPAAGAADGQHMAMAGGAADAVARASRLVRRLGDDAIAMLSDTALTEDQRAHEFRRLLLTSFDVDMIGRLALGRHGRTATPAQFAEYRRLFRDFVVATYSRRFSSYSGETLAIKTTRPANKGVVVVATEIARTDGPPVRVDWLVRERNGSPKVIDVVVAGVSMAITHRSEFAAVINRAGGIDGLIAELRARSRS